MEQQNYLFLIVASIFFRCQKIHWHHEKKIFQTYFQDCKSISEICMFCIIMIYNRIEQVFVCLCVWLFVQPFEKINDTGVSFHPKKQISPKKYMFEYWLEWKSLLNQSDLILHVGMTLSIQYKLIKNYDFMKNNYNLLFFFHRK